MTRQEEIELARVGDGVNQLKQVSRKKRIWRLGWTWFGGQDPDDDGRHAARRECDCAPPRPSIGFISSRSSQSINFLSTSQPSNHASKRY
jgi:hypothetical protein